VLGRPLIALFCEYEAKTMLASGNYTLALNWLDVAHFFNPALDQLASYHIERGQAMYFSYIDQEGDDSHAYLASVYRSQKDYLDAYTLIVTVWHTHRTTPWVVDEMSFTLERLTEYAKPLYGLRLKRVQDNDTASAWLQLLKQVDPTNVYARYMTGRIYYEQLNYAVCMNEMNAVLQLSTNTDIQSSAYTYIAISEAGLGNYTGSRALLFKAITLDPNFRNDTAREELSGLR
jgi:tetratricopeptide (TPR) repeat protein